LEDATTQPAAATEGFDKVLERLREVVERLEGGNLSLEESLRVFEEGVQLSRRGAHILDGAERRVEMLLAGDDQGLRTEPFVADGRGDHGDGEPARKDD
jgi:exodeoxyribonuclease VII small subunit